MFRLLTAIYPNFVFSPISISVIMALILRGSNGYTLQEIYDAMSYNESGFDNIKEIQEAFNSIGTYYHTQPKQSKEFGYYLGMSNVLWISDGKMLNSKFIDDAKKYYHTDVKPISYHNGSRPTHKIINKYVNEKTKGAILTCDIRKENFDAKTQIVMVNSVSFSAFWGPQLAENLETLAYFYSKGQFKILTTFVQTTSTLKHAKCEKIGASVVQLPFLKAGEGKEYFLYVILPDYGTPIEEVENKIHDQKVDINSLANNMTESRVNVMIPKHFPKSSLAMDRLFPFLGVNKLFQREDAELLYISNFERLSVDKIFHESVLEFNTKGSFAYPIRYSGHLSTTNHGKNIDEHITEYFANRPFLYYIVDKVNGGIVFLGKISVI
ncbi:serpin B9-like isoform X3 [Leptotrombidium deliense]|uniref:Serpin B9-like isoform X3 n=1 Tax=Leptotrombidium deliense TaxID=299467 RepID=A0A443S7F3_9ACAR|nr:serpin B9-like isoform X3 [Leptotrombidium deliense]